MNQLNQIENLIKGNQSEFDFNTLYPFTTENIDGYMDLFDLKNKSL